MNHRPALLPLSATPRRDVDTVLAFATACRQAVWDPAPEARLQTLEARLRDPSDPLQRLRDRRRLPADPLWNLLDATRRDAGREGYPDFATLMSHVRDTASPVARLLLPMATEPEPRALGYADTLAGAVYLLHRLEHAGRDARRGRVYLPQADLDRFRVTPEQLAGEPEHPAVRRLLTVQIAKARRLLKAASPLGRVLRGRNGLALRMLVLAADRRAELWVDNGTTATLGAPEWLLLTARAVYHGKP